MPVHIALYRGLNVGGKNAVKMEALRALHQGLGHQNAKSYIQSGNIVFSAEGDAKRLARQIAAEFARAGGFVVRVVVVDAISWGSIVADSPFAKPAATNPKTVHAAICDGEPSREGLRELLKKTGGTESFETAPGVIYLHAPDGFGTSKFAAGMEKACGVPITVRNWQTVESLWKMAQEMGMS